MVKLSPAGVAAGRGPLACARALAVRPPLGCTPTTRRHLQRFVGRFMHVLSPTWETSARTRSHSPLIGAVWTSWTVALSTTFE